jgi:hypothetical protein
MWTIRPVPDSRAACRANFTGVIPRLPHPDEEAGTGRHYGACVDPRTMGFTRDDDPCGGRGEQPDTEVCSVAA